MQNGLLSEQTMLEHGTKGKESGLFRTPDAHMERGTRSEKNLKSRLKRKMPLNLNDQLSGIQKGLLPDPKMNFPTPSSGMWKQDVNDAGDYAKRVQEGGHQVMLPAYVKLFPTPTAGLEKHSTKKEYWENRIKKGRQNDIQMQIYKEEGKGTLNSEWVEWLMGYPIGWTDIGLENQKESQELGQDKQTECKDSKDSETL